MKKLMQALLLFAFATGVGGLVVAVRGAPPAAAAPDSRGAEPLPLEQWATADAGPVVRRMVLGKLKPHPGQKTEGCDPELGEQERGGACWMKTELPPPCPKGKLQEDEGKCWRPVPKTARAPQSGDPRPGTIADP